MSRATLRLLGAGVGALLLLPTSCAREIPLRNPTRTTDWLDRTNQQPPAYDSTATAARDIPGGNECLRLLRRNKIEFRRTGKKRGVETPVVVLGPLGKIRYTVGGKTSLLCDCRLAIALHRTGPTLSSIGVTEIKGSGAYVYRTTSSGKPSRHALGLALDAHYFRFRDGSWRSVKRDFGRNLGFGCKSGNPRLNRIACKLRKLRLFRELITPDHNSDHHDHFHLAIGPR